MERGVRRGITNRVLAVVALVAVAAGALSIVPSTVAQAAPFGTGDCTISAVASGRWDLASTWSPNRVPTAADIVCVPTQSITVQTAAVAAGVVSTGLIALTFPGTLTISGARASVFGGLTIGNGTSVSVPSVGEPHVGDRLTFDGGSLVGEGDVTVTERLLVSGSALVGGPLSRRLVLASSVTEARINANALWETDATLVVSSGVTVTQLGGMRLRGVVENRGAWLQGNTIHASGLPCSVACQFHNTAEGVYRVTANHAHQQSVFLNDGRVVFDPGVTATYGQIGGQFRQTSGGVTDLGSSGTLSLACCSPTHFIAGTITGSGTSRVAVDDGSAVTGSISPLVVQRRPVGPGPGIGIIGVGGTPGDWQHLDSALIFDISPTAPAGQSDRIDIAGALSIGATAQLVILTPSGFTPTIGDEITLMTFGSRTGQYSTSNVSGLGTTWQLIQDATSIRLRAITGHPATTTTSTTTTSTTTTSTTTTTRPPSTSSTSTSTSPSTTSTSTTSTSTTSTSTTSTTSTTRPAGTSTSTTPTSTTRPTATTTTTTSIPQGLRNRPPNAVLGALAATSVSGGVLALDGSKSFDPDEADGDEIVEWQVQIIDLDGQGHVAVSEAGRPPAVISVVLPVDRRGGHMYALLAVFDKSGEVGVTVQLIRFNDCRSERVFTPVIRDIGPFRPKDGDQTLTRASLDITVRDARGNVAPGLPHLVRSNTAIELRDNSQTIATRRIVRRELVEIDNKGVALYEGAPLDIASDGGPLAANITLSNPISQAIPVTFALAVADDRGAVNRQFVTIWVLPANQPRLSFVVAQAPDDPRTMIVTPVVDGYGKRTHAAAIAFKPVEPELLAARSIRDLPPGPKFEAQRFIVPRAPGRQFFADVEFEIGHQDGEIPLVLCERIALPVLSADQANRPPTLTVTPARQTVRGDATVSVEAIDPDPAPLGDEAAQQAGTDGPVGILEVTLDGEPLTSGFLPGAPKQTFQAVIRRTGGPQRHTRTYTFAARDFFGGRAETSVEVTFEEISSATSSTTTSPPTTSTTSTTTTTTAPGRTTTTPTTSTTTTSTTTTSTTVSPFISVPSPGSPAARLVVSPTSGAAPLAVTADGSASTAAPGGGLASWTLDFGDGSAPASGTGTPRPTPHSYQRAGTFDVVLTVTASNGERSTARQSVTVRSASAPVARLTVAPLTGEAPQIVEVDGRESTAAPGRTIVSWRIDWGDGTRPVSGTSGDAGDLHTYRAAGTYTVTLTITDDAGQTGTATARVTIGSPSPPTTPNRNPVASLSVSPSIGRSPLPVTFTLGGADADGTISSWTLAFGDGQSSQGTGAPPATATHTYTAVAQTAQDFTATLTVRDNRNAVGIDGVRVRASSVQSPPIPNAAAIVPSACFVGDPGREAVAARFRYVLPLNPSTTPPVQIPAGPFNNVQPIVKSAPIPGVVPFQTFIVPGAISPNEYSLLTNGWVWELAPNMVRAEKGTIVTDSNRCPGGSLRVEGEATPVEADRGQTVTVNLRALNASGANVSGPVVVVAQLPVGAFTSPTGTAANGWACAIQGRSVACRRPDSDNPTAGYESPVLALRVTIPQNADVALPVEAGILRPSEVTGTNAELAGRVETLGMDIALGRTTVGITVRGFVADAGPDQPVQLPEATPDDDQLDNPAPLKALTPGPDGTTLVPTRVTLDGSRTTSDGRPQTFVWTKLSGPAITWVSTTPEFPGKGFGQQPIFTPSPDAIRRTYEFRLDVTAAAQGGRPALTKSDNVRVVIDPAVNRPPQITAITVSPATAPLVADQVFTLNATVTDPDGDDKFTYTWAVARPVLTTTQTASVLTNPTNGGRTIQFMWPKDFSSPPDQVVVELTVTEQNRTPALSATRSVDVGAAPPPLSVTLSADRQTQQPGRPVTFTATATPAAGVTYTWRRLSGPVVTIPSGNSNTKLVTLPATAADPLVVEVTATSGNRTASATETVGIEAPPALSVEIPDPGRVAYGAPVAITPTIRGTDPITATWTRVSGANVTLSTNPATKAVSFTAPPAPAGANPPPSSVTLRISVTDGSGAATSATVIVEIGPAPPPPSSNPGDVCTTGILGQVLNGLPTIRYGTLVVVNLGNVNVSQPCTADSVVNFTGASLSVANAALTGSNLTGRVTKDGVCLTDGTVQATPVLKLPEATINIDGPLCTSARALTASEAALADAQPGGQNCLLSGRLTYADRFPFLNVPGVFTPGPATIDFECGKLRVRAQGTLSGVAVLLDVTAQGNGNFSGSVTANGVPLLGGTVNLSGSVAKSGEVVTYAIEGTLTNPALGIPGMSATSATVRWTDQGITVNANASFSPTGTESLGFTLSGVWRSNADWSLSASATAGNWSPSSGLVVAKGSMVGQLKRVGGATTFDVTLDATGNWAVLGPDTLVLRSVKARIANLPAPAQCPGLAAGEAWLSLSGDGTLRPPAPPGATPIELTAGGCIGMTSGSFKLNLGAKLNSWRPIAEVDVVINELRFSVTRTGTSFELEGFGSAAVRGLDLTARVLFLQPGNVLVIDGGGDLRGLGIPGVESGHVMYSSAFVPQYETDGLAPFDLPAGLSAAANFSIPDGMRVFLNDTFGLGLAPGAGLTAIASLGAGAATLKVVLNLGPGVFVFKTCPAAQAPACADPNTATWLRLKSGFLFVSTDGSFGLGGEAELHMASSGDGRPPSTLNLTAQLSIGLVPQPSITLALYTTGDWNDALGIRGLTLGELAIQGGLVINPPPAPPTPTIAVLATVRSLPGPADKAAGGIDLRTPLGIRGAETMRFAVQISQSAPIFELTLGEADGNMFLRPLTMVDPNGIEGDIAKGFEVDHASLIIAPLGGTIGPRSYPPGLTAEFAANVMGTPVEMRANLGLLPPSLEAHAAIGSVTVQGMRLNGAAVDLEVKTLPPTFRMEVTGSVKLGNQPADPTMSVSALASADLSGLKFAFDGAIASWEVAPLARFDNLSVRAEGALSSLTAPPTLQLAVAASGSVLEKRMAFSGEIAFSGVTLTLLELKAAPGPFGFAGLQLRGRNNTEGACSTIPGAPSNSPCAHLRLVDGQLEVFRLEGGMDAGAASVEFAGEVGQSGMQVNGELTVPGLTTSPLAVEGAIYTRDRSLGGLVQDGLVIPTVPVEEGDEWTFDPQGVKKGDWYVRVGADEPMRIAGFGVSLHLRAGRVNGVDFAAASGGFSGDEDERVRGDIDLAGVLRLAGGQLDVDIRGTGSLFVDHYRLASAAVVVQENGLRVSGAFDIPGPSGGNSLHVNATGAACFGRCPGLIPATSGLSTNSTRFSFDIAGNGSLTLDGFSAAGGAVLRNVPGETKLEFTGRADNDAFTVDVSGSFTVSANRAVHVCAEGQGVIKLNSQGSGPQGTVKFCTDLGQVSVGFSSGGYSFSGNVTASSLTLSSALKEQVWVAWNWHPCGIGHDFASCRDRVKYNLQGTVTLGSSGLRVSGSGAVAWFTDRTNASNPPASLAPVNELANAAGRFVTDPLRVCVDIVGVPGCLAI